MFVDKVNILVTAGSGGNGVVSFRHEKYVDKGGPDGGDGGNGGDVVVVADRNQDTLAAFRYQKQITAPDGGNGEKRKRHGKSGKDLEVMVPIGTVITKDGEIIADLTEEGQRAVIATGGKGGFGNAHFISSVRQAPRVAEKGEPGEEGELTFEIKMIADVGLIGLPNAGKSTLLSRISNAKPEIANYPFTTLTPNLGVVDVGKEHSLLVADIPGLIEGASQGKGLGDEFLRHVERTSVLLHLIDSYAEDVVSDYKTIQQELKDYSVDLTKRPQIVVLTKVDGLDGEIVEDLKTQLEKVIPKKTPLLAISSNSGEGLQDLIYTTDKIVQKHKAKLAKQEKEELPILTFEEPEDRWQIEKRGKDFVVTGKKLEAFARRTDFADYHGVQRMRDILKKRGVLNALVKQNIDAGQKIIIGDPAVGELEY